MYDLLAEIQTTAFWLGLVQIIGINIVLSGDNAVVIALAARQLPETQRRTAVIAGAGGAVVLRVVLTIFAAALLQLAWVKTVGGLLLLWIAIKLLAPEQSHNDDSPAGSGSFWQAVRIILVADFIMSLDNVIGIAAAAHGSLPLLVLGLAVSVPLIMFSSTLIMVWMERLPWIITAGGALLGWVGATTIVTDPAWASTLAGAEWLETLAGCAGVALVLGTGRWMARRASRPLVEIGSEEGR